MRVEKHSLALLESIRTALQTLNFSVILLELTIQIVSNGKTVRSKTLQDIKDFNSQSLATQAKKKKTISF